MLLGAKTKTAIHSRQREWKGTKTNHLNENYVVSKRQFRCTFNRRYCVVLYLFAEASVKYAYSARVRLRAIYEEAYTRVGDGCFTAC